MSCLKDKIIQKIVKSATSYIIKESEVVIPVTDKRTIQAAYRMAQKKVENLNAEFKANKFGAVVSVNNGYTDGVGIKIHPSKKLENAYEVRLGNKTMQQFEQDARTQQQQDARRAGVEYSDDYLFASRRGNSKPSGVTKPLGDNYIELLEWKENQLDNIDAKINRVKLELRYNDSKENRKRLKNLEDSHEKLANQIDVLRANEQELMFHAIYDDLADLDEALKSDDIHEVDEVKNKVDWYQKFNEQLDGDYSKEAKKISAEIGKLLFNYGKISKEKTFKVLGDDIQVQKSLENLNNNEDARQQLNLEEGEDVVLENLLVANKDISKGNKYFYGEITSWTSDTIIPQFIMNNAMKVVNKHENRVISIINRLDEFNEKYGERDIDRNELVAKDDEGNPTGWLTDLYSPKWFNELRTRSKLIGDYYNAEFEDKKKAYDNIWNWHKKNTAIVNFFKIPAIKEIYGNHPDYQHYFTHDDATMFQYEKDLQSILGPRYDYTINTLLNKLEKFEEFKNDNVNEERYTENLAQRNLWQFLDKYLRNDKSEMMKTDKGYPVYFSTGFSDLSFVARQKRTDTTLNDDGTFSKDTVDTGFYSQDFQDIINDEALLELWDIYREMSEYIDASYNEINYGRLAYPKVEKLFTERILNGLNNARSGNFGQIGKMFRGSLHEFKSFFYEKGFNTEGETDIAPNKVDRSSKQFRDLKRAYQIQGKSAQEAEKLANKKLLKTYSSDMDRNFKASLLAAAMHNARMEVEPMSKMMFNYFKTITDINGNERKNAVERLEYYINKVILNQSTASRGKNTISGKELPVNNGLSRMLSYLQDNTAFGKKYIREHGLRLLSEQEKIIFEEFQKVKDGNYASNFKPIRDTIGDEEFFFEIKKVKVKGKETNRYFTQPLEQGVERPEVTKEEFDKQYDEYITKKLDSLGLSTNLAGLIDGTLKIQILKGLGLNMVSGLFNRIEGMHTIMIMDMTGAYWSVGNSDIAKEMMAFANVRNFSDRLKGITGNEKGKQIDIFQQFLERLGGLQDRKDDLQKSADKNKFINSETLDIYKWAVTNPEFKNQGTVILSILMDEVILDNNGNEHFLLDKETKKFTPFDIDENGVMTIKPEFSESFNFESEQMQNLMVKASNAVSHSQGNYNEKDIMLAKKTIWGRALTLFKTWMPEAIFQRFGITEDSRGGEVNVNLAYAGRQRQGRFIEGFKASKTSTIAFGLGAMGVSFGLLGGVGLVGAAGLSAYVYKKFLSKIANDKSVGNDVSTILKLIEFIKSTLIESVNYPSRVLSSVPGVNKAKIYGGKNKTFTNEKFNSLTQEEINSLKAMSRELGILLVLLMGKLSMGMLMYDDDDDKESAKRKRYNFVQNQFSKAITTLNGYASPTTFYDDSSRIGAVAFFDNLAKVVKYTVYEPDAEKRNKAFWGVAPVPRDLSRAMRKQMPWEDEYVYDNFTMSGLGELKWTQDLIKDVDTKGESSAKKEWSKVRTKERDEIKKDFTDMVDGDKNALKAIADNILEEKFGKKEKGKTYKETVDNLDTTIDHVDREKLRTKLQKKLKASGMSDKQINKIVNKRFEDYD